MPYDEPVAKEFVIRYQRASDPAERNQAMAELRNMCWPLFRHWLYRKFPYWFGQYADDFEGCFDDAITEAATKYRSDAASFKTYLSRLLYRESIDTWRQLAPAVARTQVLPNEQLNANPARPDQERILIALGEAIREEHPDCASLLELRIDPLMPSWGFYSEAAKVLAEGHGVRTVGAWRQVMDENKKHVRKFLEDRGFGLKDIE